MNAWFQSCRFKKVICQMFSYFIYETSSVNNPTPKQPPKNCPSSWWIKIFDSHSIFTLRLICQYFCKFEITASSICPIEKHNYLYNYVRKFTLTHFTWIRPNSASGDPNCFLETACSQVIPMYNQTIVNNISTALIFNF